MSERARQVVGTALATALNRLVAGSDRHADDIGLLEGRSVVLTLEPLQQGVALTVQGGRIAVLPDSQVQPDVSISGVFSSSSLTCSVIVLPHHFSPKVG